MGRAGFVCTPAENTESAAYLKTCLEHARDHADLVLLAASIPGADRLCRLVKEEQEVPVIALADIEAAMAMDGTVSDFILMTASPRELVARARRLLHARSEADDHERITAGNLTIDVTAYEVYVDGKQVSLTFKEYELLRFLATHPGRVFSRESLLNRVWGEDYLGGDRTVDVHIRRLRSKIEDLAHTYIETVRNIGYRFALPPNQTTKQQVPNRPHLHPTPKSQ
jgi:DNA-binding response OmpR family regulator